MTKEQLSQNLGTIARSGTSEFVQQISERKNSDSASLIGQFGLGFYSSFLVSSRVTVASKSVDSPQQFVFESEADAEGFKVYEDPRGNTLGRGTEITLWLKDEAVDEFASEEKLGELIKRHASFNSAPIYLWEGDSAPATDSEDSEEKEVEIGGNWKLVNDQAPLWMRDPKEVTDEEYSAFYEKTFSDPKAPIGWSHFKGDIGSTTFRALVYLPSGTLMSFSLHSHPELIPGHIVCDPIQLFLTISIRKITSRWNLSNYSFAEFLSLQT
jgi:heat shock protein beta